MDIISFEVALEMLRNMKAICISKLNKATGEDKQNLLKEYDMLTYEFDTLYKGPEDARNSVYDKIKRLYSPILKEYFGTD